MKKIKVDKVILYYMDRVDPYGNLYRFYVYKDMASEIEYFCTEETGNMTIPIGEGKYIEIVPREIVKIPVRGYRKLTGRPYVILKKLDMMKMGTQDTKYHYLIAL